jgi:hypothetical protein
VVGRVLFPTRRQPNDLSSDNDSENTFGFVVKFTCTWGWLTHVFDFIASSLPKIILHMTNCYVPIFPILFDDVQRDRRRRRVDQKQTLLRIQICFQKSEYYLKKWARFKRYWYNIACHACDRQRRKITASNPLNINNNNNNTNSMCMSHHVSDSWWTTQHTRFIVLDGVGRYVISMVFKTRHGLNTRHGWRYENIVIAMLYLPAYAYAVL